MAKNTERFTIYMNERERDALRHLARQFNTSENAVVKILIRDAAGLPLPDEYLAQLRDSAQQPA
jgi:hypothetical protein